ncbi:DEAD/DEAH box helicase [Marinicellulosiphila megalodicopiae]|uniref:DEAD/DEAH box helicase n=1 Tax=Marinicellulosiphila megalodicopiae TaxID=2724896 RepID=UPI003BAEC98E
MKFTEAFLNKDLIVRILKKGYSKPTDIQTQVFEPILQGKDVTASAQTGTGKTAAFVWPILQSMLSQENNNKPLQVIVLTPTRELAYQVFEQFEYFAQPFNITPALIIGGEKIDKQIEQINQGAQIIVATLGRLIDLNNQDKIDLSNIQTLVLDEADRMLDLGFEQELKEILKFLPAQKQTLLFSATYPESIKSIISQYLTDPLFIKSAKENTVNKDIKQWAYEIDKKDKPQAIMQMLNEYIESQVIIFCKTKRTVDLLEGILSEHGFSIRAIHADKSQNARNSAMKQFKNKEVQALIATDIAARGLDIKQLPLVINYDLPFVPEDYIHRIGRTGRAGKQGIAISLVCADQFDELVAIEHLLTHIIERDMLTGLVPSHNVPISNLDKPKEKEDKNITDDVEIEAGQKPTQNPGKKKGPQKNIQNAKQKEKPLSKRAKQKQKELKDKPPIKKKGLGLVPRSKNL